MSGRRHWACWELCLRRLINYAGDDRICHSNTTTTLENKLRQALATQTMHVSGINSLLLMVSLITIKRYIYKLFILKALQSVDSRGMRKPRRLYSMTNGCLYLVCWQSKNTVLWKIRCKCRKNRLPAHPRLCFFLFRRSAYCAASVASLTNILTPKLFEDTTNWILRYNPPPQRSIIELLKTVLCLHFSINQGVFLFPLSPGVRTGRVVSAGCQVWRPTVATLSVAQLHSSSWAKSICWISKPCWWELTFSHAH